MNPLKQKIDSQLSNLIVTDSLREEVLQKSQKKNTFVKKSSIGILAACIMIMLTAGVVGDTNLFQKVKDILGNTYESELLQAVPPKEDGISPNTNNGISMNVAAALSDNETAVLYLVVQDFTEKRLDNSVQLENLTFQNETGGISWTYDSIHYDDKTNSSIIKLTLNGSHLDNRSIHMSVNSILSKRKNCESFLLDNTLQQFVENHQQPLFLEDEYIDEQGNSVPHKVLKMDQMNIPLSNDFPVSISNIGVIDDTLHIQTKCIGLTPRQYSPSFQLIENDTPVTNYSFSNQYFYEDKQGNLKSFHLGDYFETEKVYYIESIFDLEELKQAITLPMNEVKVSISLTTYETYIRGDWDLTFYIQAVKEIVLQNLDITYNNIHFTNLILSPIGITLKGFSDSYDFEEEASIYAIMSNGRRVMLQPSGGEWSSLEPNQTTENTCLKFMFDEVLDISDIVLIQIDELEIPIHNTITNIAK